MGAKWEGVSPPHPQRLVRHPKLGNDGGAIFLKLPEG
jgi:hypothetical protein